MNGEMHEEFLSEIIFISLQNFAFLLVISLRKNSICRQQRISLRLFNFLLREENYIHFSSELSSSKNFSFILLGLTISAQLGTISLFSREMVQPSMKLADLTYSTRTRRCTSKYGVCLSNTSVEWQKGTCTCPSFLKNYICKYIIGTSIRLKYCKPPPEGKNVEIGTKRKRGR